MAAIWYEQDTPGGVEYFIRKFLRSDMDEWNDPMIRAARSKLGNEYKKPYRDSKLLAFDKEEEYRFAFKFTKLSHVASWGDHENEGVKGILSSNCFRGRDKKMGDANICLSWWGIDTTSAEFRVENCTGGPPVDCPDWCAMGNMKSVVKSLLMKSAVKYDLAYGVAADEKLDIIADSFGNSPPFSAKSLYGNYKFTIPLKKVFESYKALFPVPEPQNLVFRIGGTFRYPQEIMHAVIVHPDSDEVNRLFDRSGIERLNMSDDGSMVSVSDHDGSSGIWRPDSTGNKMRDSKGWRCWNCVGFAFYMKDDKHEMKFDENQLISYLSVCEAEEPSYAKLKITSLKAAKHILLKWASRKSDITFFDKLCDRIVSNV